MMTLNVNYKNQLHSLFFPEGLAPTVAALQAEIQRVIGIQPDAQRLFQNRRRIDCSDISRRLRDVCDDAVPLLLMAGASKAQIENMTTLQSAAQQETKIRETRRVVNIAKRNRAMQARKTGSTSYCFHALEPLEKFADKEKAYEILEKLANDRGILAVMAKHKWSVGVLAEMPPDGKVGVDPVCVLGLNQNKGQKILLRLRTDDSLGFRKFLSIKKVLFHELAHNVHSEHDSDFYLLMRQVEKECTELDWTQSNGATAGRISASVDERDSTRSVESGYRLGGGSAQTSRLLKNIPGTRERMVSTTTQEASTEQRSTTEFGSEIISDEIATKAKSQDATSELANTSHAALALTTTPKFHVMNVDEQVATLAMSGREKRVYNAVRQLQTHYSAEVITKAASLLYKIVSNIISHPIDAKFRSIRKTNRVFSGQVAKIPECLDFLLALGFEDQLDNFVLIREDPALLWIGRSTLEVLLPATA